MVNHMLVGSGVLTICIVFTIVTAFLLANTPQAIAQATPFVKFDQPKIIIKHYDVITFFDPNISNSSVNVTVESFNGAGVPLSQPKIITLGEVGAGSGSHLYTKMVNFTTTPSANDIGVVDNGSVIVRRGSYSDTASITLSTGTQTYGPIRLDNSYQQGCTDVDLDAVCDTWEANTSSLTINYPSPGSYTTSCSEAQGFLDDKFNVFTPCSGTDKRDIYVEIDYMLGHRPNEEALKKVVEAFYNAPQGIRLHIQIDDVNATSIFHKKLNAGYQSPYNECTTFPGLPSGQQRGFDQLKSKFFGTDSTWKQKKQVFHYALFVHNQCSGASSGNAEVFGNDMIISLGSFDGSIGNPEQQAGTFMHELGHNLNLGHGGPPLDILDNPATPTVNEALSINCKPNHLSVLSYSRQFPDLVSNRALDYSRQILGSTGNPNLITETPVEQQGITDYIFNPQEKIIWGPIIPSTLPPTNGGCVNWNRVSPSCETSPASPPIDLNLISSGNQNVCDGAGTSFSGYNDWANINLNSKGMGTWQDGRSSGAGPRVAVWESGAVNPSNFMPSFFCPSIQQIAAVIPNGTTGEQNRGHFSNYRACAAGVGESNKTVIACYNYLAIQTSLKLDSASYDLNDTKFNSFDTPTAEITDLCNKFLEETNSTELLLFNNASGIIGAYANLSQQNNSKNTTEIIGEFQNITGSSEITSKDVKILRFVRLDSINATVYELDESDFIGNRQDTLNYTDQSLAAIRTAIENDNMTLATYLISQLNYTGKIQTGEKLHNLEEFIYDAKISYNYAPEFGTVATLILVVSIISIIIITTKTRINLFKIQASRTY